MDKSCAEVRVFGPGIGIGFAPLKFVLLFFFNTPPSMYNVCMYNSGAASIGY